MSTMQGAAEVSSGNQLVFQIPDAIDFLYRQPRKLIRSRAVPTSQFCIAQRSFARGWSFRSFDARSSHALTFTLIS